MTATNKNETDWQTKALRLKNQDQLKTTPSPQKQIHRSVGYCIKWAYLISLARYKNKVLGESKNSYHQRNKREVKVTNLLLVEFLTSFRQLLFQICQKF